MTTSNDTMGRSPGWVAAGVVCLALFAHVSLPIFGSTTRFAIVATVAILALGHTHFTCARSGAALAFLPGYYALPAIADPSVRFAAADVLSTVGLGLVAVLVAREVQSERGRGRLVEALVLSASLSGLVAVAQRQGLVPPLAIDLWGRATAADGSLRGAGLLPDPNFLAVLLAAAVPLAFSWRRVRLRPVALVAIAAGLHATNSRTGMLLGVAALVVVVALQRGTWGETSRRRGRWLLQFAAALLVMSFALNLGGQRDRLVDGVQTALSGTGSAMGSVDAAATLSARDRRDYAIAWFELGWDRFPFGAGVDAEHLISTDSGRQNAAHNNFIHAFAQGGIFGLGVVALTLSSLVTFFRRRVEPLSVFGSVVILGGAFLSYPASVFFLLPIGLADGIGRANFSSAASQERPPVEMRARPAG